MPRDTTRTRRAVFALLVAPLLATTIFSSPALSANDKQLREARSRYQRIQQQLNKLAEQYAKQKEKADNLEIQIGSTNRAIRKASSDAAALQVRLKARVRTAYRLGGVGFFDFLLSSHSFRDFSLRAVMLERQSSEDEDVILKLRRVRSDLDSKQHALKGQKRSQANIMLSLRQKAGELDTAFGTAQGLLSRLEDQRRLDELTRGLTRKGAGGGGRAFALLRCPAAGPHAFSNDWGAPRGGGRRRHKGNDVFAPMGSPAVAVVPGRITRHSSGGNGGLAVYLFGDDGNEYYYAHMSGFSVPPGSRVSTGQTIAYVGNTGNARGGAPHIHFEIHPGGGSAVNPYFSLIRVC